MLGGQGVQGAGCQEFRVLRWVFRCSGCWVFRVFMVFRVLGTG